MSVDLDFTLGHGKKFVARSASRFEVYLVVFTSFTNRIDGLLILPNKPVTRTEFGGVIVRYVTDFMGMGKKSSNYNYDSNL